MNALSIFDWVTSVILLVDFAVLMWVWINRNKWRQLLTDRRIEREEGERNGTT